MRPQKNQKRQGGTGAQPGCPTSTEKNQAEYQDAEAERKKAEAGTGAPKFVDGSRWTPYYTVAINGVKMGYNLPLEMAENIWVTGVVNLHIEVITPCMFAKNREV